MKEKLILGMIIAGSMLMVYNIIRYAVFIKKNDDLEKNARNNGINIIPLLLLVFFLIGYLIVGFSGIADYLIAAILLGGSIFVFLLLWVMYSIVGHVRGTEQILAARYEEIKQQISELTKNSNSMFRVNLTKDEIEERSGDFLYDSDMKCEKYSELIEARSAYILDAEYEGTDSARFTREGLLEQYQEGITNVSETVLVRMRDGSASFVRFEAVLTKKPVSDDIVAFLVESPYNEEVVRRTLLENVIMGEYDRVAYIIDGKYKLLSGNTDKKEERLFIDDSEDTYESVYLNYFLPAMTYDRSKPNPLRLSVIEKELSAKDYYDVDAPFTINGDLYYKHFAFYKINGKVKFYLMLLSDSTKIREEQEKRNRELSEALAAAVRSNESRVRFFSNISHVLRTPMNGILGFAELASKETDAEKMRSYVSKITSSGYTLLARINDLFDMSLIESKTLKLETAPVDLKALSDSIVTHLSGECAEKELTVAVDTSGLTDHSVLCDAARLTQIIVRMLENSIMFSPEKSVITLSVSEEKGDGKQIFLFRVRNKGERIPREIVDHMFEPEVWNAGSLAGDISAAGIGMVVVKALVDLMGGTAEIKEENGEVFFDVRLPFEVVPEKTEPAGIAEDASVGELKLLVVDDNEINREIAQLILEGDGHSVELAVNGAEAVEKVRDSEECYDVVFMDVQMPVMNGYEATAAIRALPDPARASVPIIAMTANAYQEDQNDAISAGMNAYIPKPINPDDIRATLKRVLFG